MGRRGVITLVVAGVVLLAAAALRLLVGGPDLAWPDSEAVWGLRAARLGAGAGVGACLALAGVYLQSLLRNPLASPDLLGLASGAGLVVMIATYAGYLATGELVRWAGNGPPALVGSLGALGLVYVLSQRRGLIDPVSMILIGVVVGIVCAAGTVFVQHLMPDRGQSAARWLLGGLSDHATTGEITAIGVLAVLGIAAGVGLAPGMDAAALSEEEARAVGVPLGRLRVWQFLLAGVLTAGAVALAGPIGFVGLVCPHLIRLGAGPGHRSLIIGSALAGAALVVGSDALIKAVDIGGGRLPIGVLTSAVGGPVFVALLMQQRNH